MSQPNHNLYQRGDFHLLPFQNCPNRFAVQAGPFRSFSQSGAPAQERLAGEGLHASAVVQAIRQARSALASAPTTDALRLLESQAAYAYWSAWRSIPVSFPKNDVRRVPDHWLTFGTRISPLTGSPRLAVNPANAILNYLYAVLESEARLGIAAMGLDPGLGVMHADNPIRDSLVFDVMEPVRPLIDAYVLDWIGREPLRRDWFFEERNGNARLMGSFAVLLSDTAPTWARAVAPVAEVVARALSQAVPRRSRQTLPATRLTQTHRRKARGGSPDLQTAPPPRAPRLCRTCGASLKDGATNCAACNRVEARERITQLARKGREISHRPEAEARRAESQRRQAAALKTWNPPEQPDWLTAKAYREKIRPRLASVAVPAIASALGVSEPYAAAIRAGRRFPHPRHWQALARLVGL